MSKFVIPLFGVWLVSRLGRSSPSLKIEIFAFSFDAIYFRVVLWSEIEIEISYISSSSRHLTNENGSEPFGSVSSSQHLTNETGFEVLIEIETVSFSHFSDVVHWSGILICCEREIASFFEIFSCLELEKGIEIGFANESETLYGNSFLLSPFFCRSFFPPLSENQTGYEQFKELCTTDRIIDPVLIQYRSNTRQVWYSNGI